MYIAITTPSKWDCVKRLEFGKRTLVDSSLRVYERSTFVQYRASRVLLSEASHQDDWKERVWLPKI